MASLNGLLDGDTAATLKGLFGVDNDSESPSENEELKAAEWDDYDSYEDFEVFCDNCADPLTEEEAKVESKTKELFCSDCARRTYSHAVSRFTSTRDRDLEIE